MSIDTGFAGITFSSTDDALTTSFLDGASITFTPGVASHDWFLMPPIRTYHTAPLPVVFQGWWGWQCPIPIRKDGVPRNIEWLRICDWIDAPKDGRWQKPHRRRVALWKRFIESWFEQRLQRYKTA